MSISVCRKPAGVSEAQLQDISQKYEQLHQDATTTEFLSIKYIDLCAAPTLRPNNALPL